MSKRPGEHSSLRHLAWSLWGNHDPERCLMAMFTAYFDASGKPHDPTVFLVSGFVSSERKWLRFEDEWAAFLKEWGIRGTFHTTDYIKAQMGTHYEQFHGNDPLRDEFERRAVKVIRRGIRKPVSCGLLLEDYRRVLAEYRLPDAFGHFRHPYSLCAIHCTLAVVFWGDRRMKSNDLLEFIYEDGDDDKGFFIKEFKKINGEPPIFRTKDKHPQFQAADILAWRHARLLKITKGNMRKDKRHAFSTIFREWPHEDCVFIGEEIMRGVFDEWGLERLPNLGLIG